MYTAELPKGSITCNTYRLYFNNILIGLLYLTKDEVDKLLRILNTHPITE